MRKWPDIRSAAWPAMMQITLSREPIKPANTLRKEENAARR